MATSRLIGEAAYLLLYAVSGVAGSQHEDADIPRIYRGSQANNPLEPVEIARAFWAPQPHAMRASPQC